MSDFQSFDDIKGSLHSSWFPYLQGEFEKPYMRDLQKFLETEYQQGKVIYPPSSKILNAFNKTPFEQVKVVILGQDPYHGPHQAHGLSFSVPAGIKCPPSLANIFKEIQQDLDITMSGAGDLTSWAEQGVLLLNATLSVEQGRAGSHQKKGWEKFTDAAIRAVNDHLEDTVFILWGSYAHKKGSFINQDKHLVLKSVHPSPLSAHRGFFGNKQFSTTNQYLIEHGREPIDWAI